MNEYVSQEMAKTIIVQVRNIRKCNNCSMEEIGINNKEKLYTKFVTSRMLYGSETRCLCECESQRLTENRKCHGRSIYGIRQTDTTVLNPVMSPESEGGQIHLNVVIALDLHKLKVTQKADLLEQKYLTGSTSLLTSTTVLRHVVV